MKRIIITICITALLLQVTVLAPGLGCRYAVNECEKTIDNEIPLDYSFITDIIQKLSNITFKNKNWLGREYGTSGDRYAAKMLGDAWNRSISNDYINHAVLDLIDKGISGDGIDDKFGVRSREDYKLVINDEEIPDAECFPVYPIPNRILFTSYGIPSDQHFDFNDAEILMVQDEVYKKASLNLQQVITNQPENEYLIGNNEQIANMDMQEEAVNTLVKESQ